MKKNILFVTLSLFVSVLFSMFIVSGAQDFSVNPTTLNLSSTTSGSDSVNFTINSNVNNLNLTLTSTTLVNGSNSISLNLNETSFNNLTNTSSMQITASISDAKNIVGIFTGNITINNSDNSSDFEIIPVSLTVSAAPITGSGLILVDCSDKTTIKFEMDADISKNTESFRFCIKNTGTIALRDITIDMPSNFDTNNNNNDKVDDNDFEINNNGGEKTYSLDDDFNSGDSYILLPGEISDRIKFSLDVPSSLDPDTYRGNIKFKASNDQGVNVFSENFQFKILVFSNKDDVLIKKKSLYVDNSILEIKIEPGTIVDDYSLIIDNNAGYDVTDMHLELDGDLQEENSNNKLLKSLITFSPNLFDVDKGNEDSVDVIVEIPENQPVGTYTADLKLVSSAGKQLGDKITLRIKIVGDVYIDNIDIGDGKVKPGDSIDVKINIVNSGSQLIRNVKVLGSLFDIDTGNSDIHESSSTFLLDSNTNRNEVLRFRIPKDATDGLHTLEIRLQYGEDELVEVESIDVERPVHKIDIMSFAINPGVVKCNSELFTYIKFQNLGKFDEDVKIKTEILGEGISTQTNTIDVGTDDIIQKNLVLDITNLKAGTYSVEQKVTYGGFLFVKKKSTLRVDECRDSSIGVDISNINDSLINQTLINQTGNNSISLFGQDYEKGTFYLGTSIVVVFLLIIVSLFLL